MRSCNRSLIFFLSLSTVIFSCNSSFFGSESGSPKKRSSETTLIIPAVEMKSLNMGARSIRVDAVASGDGDRPVVTVLNTDYRDTRNFHKEVSNHELSMDTSSGNITAALSKDLEKALKEGAYCVRSGSEISCENESAEKLAFNLNGPGDWWGRMTCPTHAAAFVSAVSLSSVTLSQISGKVAPAKLECMLNPAAASFCEGVLETYRLQSLSALANVDAAAALMATAATITAQMKAAAANIALGFANAVANPVNAAGLAAKAAQISTLIEGSRVQVEWAYEKHQEAFIPVTGLSSHIPATSDLQSHGETTRFNLGALEWSAAQYGSCVSRVANWMAAAAVGGVAIAAIVAAANNLNLDSPPPVGGGGSGGTGGNLYSSLTWGEQQLGIRAAERLDADKLVSFDFNSNSLQGANTKFKNGNRAERKIYIGHHLRAELASDLSVTLFDEFALPYEHTIAPAATRVVSIPEDGVLSTHYNSTNANLEVKGVPYDLRWQEVAANGEVAELRHTCKGDPSLNFPGEERSACEFVLDTTGSPEQIIAGERTFRYLLINMTRNIVDPLTGDPEETTANNDSFGLKLKLSADLEKPSDTCTWDTLMQSWNCL